MRRRLCLFLASGFGLGLVAPFAPGTLGSLPGVALAFATALLPLPLQVAACAALALAAVPLCGAAERAFGIKDDGRIAADEWMLFPVALVGIPLASLPWWSMAVFFCVVRAVDIVKPWPCRGLQALPGGWGVVADDFVANLYSLAVNWTIASTML
ncbi:MAG: phosphatidylglycerophosphatase A [Kiritimatiellae bacterium]|nr:phosphatidylglycerophosphatase A [Kiritimatiellia bacterium]